MHLRNVLIAVSDLKESVRFYRDIFGLQVILDQEGNVIMTEGLVLQDIRIWKEILGRDVIARNNMTELYFEERDMEAFEKRLSESGLEIEYVTRQGESEAERKLIRLYDPDGNLIEVGEADKREI